MKRTKDGRFVDDRIDVNKKLLKDIIYSAKESRGLSWPRFAKKIGVSSVTLQHEWLLEGRTIPKHHLKLLVNLSKRFLFKNVLNRSSIKEPFWGQKILNGNTKFKKIVIPKKDTDEFAEFYGIMLGDGCVFSNLRGFSISGDKYLDYYFYHEHLKKLIHNLFGIYPSIYTSSKDRSIKAVVNSTLASRYLLEIGFPTGIKYFGRPVIPDFIFKDKKRLAECIRGLMDTDGSLSSHPHSKIMIHLSITIRSLRKSVLKGLNLLGIEGGEFNKGIMLYGLDKITEFNEIIGFSNLKNIYKYNQFKKLGRVPSSKEAEMFIRAKANV